MNPLRRIALLLALLLAVLPAHAQTTRKKTTRKKAAVTKVVKKKKTSKKKKKTATPPAEDTATADTGEVSSPEPMVFGEDKPEPAPVAPLDTPAAPVVAEPVTPPPAAPTPAATPAPSLATPTPAPSLAASSPVALFAVARVPNADNAAVKLEGELLGHLRARGDVTLVDLGAAFPPPAPGSLARADGLFEEGRTAYDNLDPEAAEAKFRAAAEAYTQSPAELSPERLAQTYIFLGASRHLNGNVDGAKEAFQLAVEADRSALPDATLFSQDVARLHDEARAAVAARPVGTLVVQSQPAGATVTVNGRELGVTPLKGVEVPAGHHPVVVSLPGYAPYASYLEVKSSASAELKAELEPTPGLAAIRDAATAAATEKAFDQDVPPAEARAIGERLGARYVVLAAVWRDKKGRAEAELQAWDLRSKARLRGVEIELTKDSKRGPAHAADQVRGFVNGAMAPRVAEGGRSGDSLIKRPWFWAVVGGAAAVTAGAIYVATSDNNGRPFNPVSGGVGF